MARLQRTLGGMRKMRRLPGALFVVDPHREHIAVTEARKLEIPVIGTGDTNVDPDQLDYIIPANDDAIRAIRLLCRLVADAAIEGAGSARGPRRRRADHGRRDRRGRGGQRRAGRGARRRRHLQLRARRRRRRTSCPAGPRPEADRRRDSRALSHGRGGRAITRRRDTPDHRAHHARRDPRTHG